MRGLMALALALLITGCTVGPDYVRPDLDVPQAFDNANRDAQQTANIAWWEQFRDPALDALIAEALAGNRDIGIAAANIEQAAAVFSQSRSAFFPQIGYGGNISRDRASETDSPLLFSVIPNPQTSHQALASASWEIDLWGRIRRLTESARADLLATEAAGQGVLLSLVSSVASGYIQLLALDEQHRVAQRTLAAYAESLRIFELRFKYGQVSRMTVAQATSQYEAAAAAVPQLESQIEQAENALSILLGRNPGPIRRGRNIHELTAPPVPAGLPSDLLASRPDIRQAEQRLIAANANIGAARALYFPAISLTGAYGFASSELSDLFKGTSRTWSFAGSLTGPIFRGGAIASGVRQAEAGRKAALLSYEKAIQSAFADVENALIAQSKLEEQFQAEKRLVEANSEYVRLARLQYEGGYVPYSTVLQAEQQLFPSELNYVQTRATLLASLVSVYKAMGGGWQAASTPLAARE